MDFIKKVKIKEVLGVSFGALLSAIAINGFVRIGHLVPSGITGFTSLIIMEIDKFWGINLSFGVYYFLFNLMILLFVYKHLGKKFLLLSFLHVFLTSLFVEFIPQKQLTNDMILLSIFGGLINGLGVSSALRMNGSAGGTDFVAIYFSMVKNKPMWDKIMLFNISMLVYYGWQYDWSLAFYSIIYQIVSTRVIESLHNRYKLSSLHIITDKPDEVSAAILKVARHGITKFDGIGMFRKQEKSILYTVVNDFEIDIIVEAVLSADDQSFIEIANVQRIEGNYRQKPLE